MNPLLSGSVWNSQRDVGGLPLNAEMLPDCKGGFTPCPYLLTESEAIRFLRLDTIQIQHPGDTLRRYRDSGQLKAVQISKSVFYPRDELQRFILAKMGDDPR